MLYERWREIADRYSSECALRDLSSGRAWSFRELDALAGSRPAEPVIFPQGSAAEFIAAVLRGWKTGATVCPLEPGQARPDFPAPARRIVHLKITSASTGPARLVALTAEQLAADARNVVETMELLREWPNLGAISLAHSYGFSNLVTPLLLHGIPLVVTGSGLPEAVRGALRQLGSATVAAVPALWRAWLEAGVLSSGTVRLAISAGAPLPLALEEEIYRNCGIKVHNFYGASECGGIAYDRSETPRRDAAVAGAPMRNVSVTVGDDGCLEVRGDAVAETYWPEPSDRLASGCFRTSDLAEIIEGLVHLRGRATDVINVAGRKIAPEAVEAALARHPAVIQCLVFGVPEENRERIVACIAARKDVSAEQLKEFLLTMVPAWQVPREFWFVENLAPDQRGKLSRAGWRAKYLARG